MSLKENLLNVAELSQHSHTSDAYFDRTSTNNSDRDDDNEGSRTLSFSHLYNAIIGQDKSLNNSFITELGQKYSVDKELSTSSHQNLKISNSRNLTIFLLVNAMIGSGILNQPYVFSQSGVVGALVGYLIAGVMTWLGLNILTATGLKVGVYDYGGLAKATLGRTGEILVDASIIIGCFGSLTGYIIVVGSTISGLFESWGCESETYCGIYFTTIFAVIIFVAPICLLRHFGHLAFLAVFSVVAIGLVLALVIIGGPVKAVAGPVRVFNPSGAVTSLGSIVFSLDCSSANFQAFVATAEEERNTRSWMAITSYVVGIGALMCVSMGLSGYLSFKEDTQGIILDNFTAHGFDFFKIMVAAHLIVYIPVSFIIMRYSVVKLAANKKSEDLRWPIHTTLTLLMLGGITAFVLLFYYVGLGSGEAFGITLDVTGGISTSMTAFILPALMYINTCTSADALYFPAWLNLFLGFAVMIGVVTITILQVV